MKKVYDQKDLADFNIDDYRCIIMRQETGHLCGYVDLPEGHPATKWNDYEDVWESDANINVHGGITYMENYLFDENDNEREGNWIGFDCAHAGDIVPAHCDMASKRDTYKDKDYVKNELVNLVEQLKDMEAN